MEQQKSTPLIDIGVAALTLQGQEECGDRHLVKYFPDGVLLAVVDGLGHGGEAAEAARIAIDHLELCLQESVSALLEECHRSLKSTRGVVMSLALFSLAGRTLTWIAVGNAEGVLLHASKNHRPRYENLLLRAGVVGDRLPRQKPFVVPVFRNDTLVLATDGIRNEFAQEMNSKDPPQQIADRILAGYSKGNDDALVLVARFR